MSLVGNHGLFGLDVPLVWLGVYRRTGRMPRGLTEEALFFTPVLRELLPRLGPLHGTFENATRFLRAGKLVNVYPGGAEEALKQQRNSYKLHWQRSKGFVRLAMITGAPIILVMGVGSDDAYRHLGRWRFPAKVMGQAKYEFPLLLGLGPLPLPAKMDYYFSEPLPLSGGPGGADDPALVDAHHARLWRLGERMLQEGLRRRGSVFFG